MENSKNCKQKYWFCLKEFRNYRLLKINTEMLSKERYTRELMFSQRNLRFIQCDIYPTFHQVRFDTRSFYCGKPRTIRDWCVAIRKILDRMEILRLKCFRRQVMKLAMHGRFWQWGGTASWDQATLTWCELLAGDYWIRFIQWCKKRRRL